LDGNTEPIQADDCNREQHLVSQVSDLEHVLHVRQHWQLLNKTTDDSGGRPT
jgi:hypothetical protein